MSSAVSPYSAHTKCQPPSLHGTFHAVVAPNWIFIWFEPFMAIFPTDHPNLEIYDNAVSVVWNQQATINVSLDAGESPANQTVAGSLGLLPVLYA